MRAPQVREAPVEVEVDFMVALVAQAVIIQTAVEAVQVTAVLFVSHRLNMHRQVAAAMDLHTYISCRSLVHSRVNNHLISNLLNLLYNQPDNLPYNHPLNPHLSLQQLTPGLLLCILL